MSTEQDAKRDFFEELVYTGFEHRGRGKATERHLFQRYTQDSPVMPDVWIAYATEPFTHHDLLLTPVLDLAPGQLAVTLNYALNGPASTQAQKDFKPKLAEYEQKLADYEQKEAEKRRKPQLSYNQTTVAVRLWFPELVQIALPLTAWWWERLAKAEDRQEHPVKLLQQQEAREELRRDLEEALEGRHYDAQRGQATANLVWMARVAGTIWSVIKKGGLEQLGHEDLDKVSQDSKGLVESLFELLDFLPAEKFPPDGQVGNHDCYELFSVNRNRQALSCMYQSVPTVKGDAARQLFSVRGADITWAVLDSGIDATHLAFRMRHRDGKPVYNPPPDLPLFDINPVEPQAAEKAPNNPAEGGKPKDTKREIPPPNQRSRIRKTYDFTRVRNLLSDEPDPKYLELLDPDMQEDLRRSLTTGRLVDWELIEPALEIKHDEKYEEAYRPTSHHGTHVAGILGADWRGDDDPHDDLPLANARDRRPDARIGVCPDIHLYDLRVVGDDGKGDEFSIMAALQFVRSLNARSDYVVIHGVNLSLSIEHAVANYACGRTPVCNECERLVGAGTVVVASAGNHGRSRYLTRHGDEEAYSTVSITDPGNAEAVITVGATHRHDPHTYGVSYFSSRGPTADGRMKPDLVAPGEKVCSTIPRNREEYFDGTSMAAPHVSGAAALLMCRYPELIGNPQRIKQVLCRTATDLGRERYFQGAGLLDILRALQSL